MVGERAKARERGSGSCEELRALLWIGRVRPIAQLGRGRAEQQQQTGDASATQLAVKGIYGMAEASLWEEQRHWLDEVVVEAIAWATRR